MLNLFFSFQYCFPFHHGKTYTATTSPKWAFGEKRFSTKILFSDEAHFWLNGNVNKQNCRNWAEDQPQEVQELPLYPEKPTVWCGLWAGGIIGPYFFNNDDGRNAIAPWYRTFCYLKLKPLIMTTFGFNRTVPLAIQLLKQWIYWEVISKSS